MPKSPIFPIGHFYSPIVDVDEVSALPDLWEWRRSRPGLELNESKQRDLLETVVARWMPHFLYPVEKKDAGDGGYHLHNDQFTWLDARALFAFLCEWRPARVIEVGSGYSTTILLDVRRRFLEGTTQISCIEPYPRPVLKEALKSGGARLIERKVQTVPMSEFEALQAGDVLFIDSSHVCKTGSDCSFLYLEVLPRLKVGVRIHIHDIFLPFEYPRRWVVDENRSWNEQYLVHALLMAPSAFKVLFGSAFVAGYLREEAERAIGPNRAFGVGGGSLWIEKVT